MEEPILELREPDPSKEGEELWEFKGMPTIPEEQEEPPPVEKKVIREEDYNECHHWIAERVEFLQNLMMLQHFQVFLLHGMPDDGQIASITPLPGYNTAGLSCIYDEFWKYPDEMKDKALIHEMVHLHFERADSAVNMGAQLIDHPAINPAIDQLTMNYQFGMEQGVEMMSRVIYKLMSK